jgi:hypothetical protein
MGGASSPLLANIAVNSLDWQLHAAGIRFVRYADDFVGLARSAAEVQQAHALVQAHLSRLGLTLSAEKTKQTRFRKGFAFLGFVCTARTVTMRPKSVEKLKAKIRELTLRNHNLDRRVIDQVNTVVPRTAHYFATAFCSCRYLFRVLDKWLRMRIRSMKYKRKRAADNWRLERQHFRHLGVVFLSAAGVHPAVEPT